MVTVTESVGVDGPLLLKACPHEATLLRDSDGRGRSSLKLLRVGHGEGDGNDMCEQALNVWRTKGLTSEVPVKYMKY